MKIVHGADVSNYYGEITPQWAAAVVAAGIQRVTVRCSLERPSMVTIACQQIATFREAGATVDGYIWCYQRADDPDRLAARAEGAYGDLALPCYWLDLEDEDGWSYDTPAQNIAWLHAALTSFDLLGRPVGIYTGRWYWIKPNRYGNTQQFADRLLWTSDFDRIPDLSNTWRYGGWTAETTAGKQWCGESSGPEAIVAGVAVDRSVWDTDKLPGAQEEDMARIAVLEAQVAELQSLLGYLQHDAAGAALDALSNAQAHLKSVGGRIPAGNTQRAREDIRAAVAAVETIARGGAPEGG